MVSFSDLLCRVKGTAEERNSKYDNMGCQVFKRGIQNWKKFEVTRTIYSNSERSEQFLVTAFLTCSWRFLRSNKLEQLELKLEKIFGI